MEPKKRNWWYRLGISGLVVLLFWIVLFSDIFPALVDYRSAKFPNLHEWFLLSLILFPSLWFWPVFQLFHQRWNRCAKGLFCVWLVTGVVLIPLWLVYQYLEPRVHTQGGIIDLANVVLVILSLLLAIGLNFASFAGSAVVFLLSF